MPFKSKAQRRKFYAMANRGEISRGTVKEWEDATKGKKLPEKVKHSFDLGVADALDHFGLKQAAEEIRLKIPSREFHGWDAAFRSEGERNAKKANDESADSLAQLLSRLEAPAGPIPQSSTRDRLDRSTAWGAPSHLDAGDTAGRLSDMGQPTSVGIAF